MKVIIISIAALIAIAFTAKFLMGSSSLKTEQHKYKVLKKYTTFEIREYEPALFSSVILSSNTYKESANKGFRILAGYIFGDNEKNQKIAMTSPVVMEMEDKTKMMFMVPSEYKDSALPRPNNSGIVFEKQEKKILAVIQFGGWANDETIEKYKIKLTEALKKEGINFKEKFIYMGYNPPYEIINRRNEVAVELISYQL